MNAKFNSIGYGHAIYKNGGIYPIKLEVLQSGFNVGSIIKVKVCSDDKTNDEILAISKVKVVKVKVGKKYLNVVFNVISFTDVDYVIQFKLI